MTTLEFQDENGNVILSHEEKTRLYNSHYYQTRKKHLHPKPRGRPKSEFKGNAYQRLKEKNKYMEQRLEFYEKQKIQEV